MTLHQRLRTLDAARLRGMKRGIEKEGLRVAPDGTLARTPHPVALGSALTHPHITTDFSESQLELVTGVHDRVEDCLNELTTIHRVVLQSLGDECMWAASMPGLLPPDADIPIGYYGTSNVGQAKRVYRLGLSHRYGSRMQTISGIHYNWSFPGLSSADYFALIRNFRRHSFLLLYLFGASPAVTSSFVAGQPHGLEALSADALHLPYATSLRMGRLGYQSDAQSALCVSYNDLEGYAHSLQEALTVPYPPYEAMGIRDAQGGYRQLATSLLQIENEFYSTIRPKRVIRSGERPLHALRERGVEYVEVRCMDINPFLPVGIDAHTARVLDVFLLHALLSDSPPDSPDEIRALQVNQLMAASRGREPGLMLQRGGQVISLRDWGLALLDEGMAVAEALDQAQGGEAYQAAWAQARRDFLAPDTLPSARVLEAIRTQHAGRFDAFGLACSQDLKQSLLSQPLSEAERATWQAQAQASLAEQAQIEAADTLDFEAFRQRYVDPAGLTVQAA
ncbi:MAG: glutamate--cysteine ligase [Aquabacterium sp.]|jgi:glutamate--cysteine ligase|uniref:glutamate--cysteine ligase n=1 Tax=Aquabacterium sp. TaxID=1872578 RepID=UPI001B643789|nr:glutamate--cysteine ligase [Aquabacterium sp.]MBP7133092.1 glutamate--cysteine ligase [Aquabacterium sp.]